MHIAGYANDVQRFFNFYQNLLRSYQIPPPISHPDPAGWELKRFYCYGESLP